MSIEAAEFCIEKDIALVGIDYNSVDRYGAEDFPVHHLLMRKDIRILEGIDLKEVEPGRYVLFCFPLKIEGAEGSPVRAALIR